MLPFHHQTQSSIQALPSGVESTMKNSKNLDMFNEEAAPEETSTEVPTTEGGNKGTTPAASGTNEPPPENRSTSLKTTSFVLIFALMSVCRLLNF